MKIKFTKSVRDKLAQRGFLMNLNGRSYVSPKCEFELPCKVSSADLSLPLEIGAYSYIEKDFRNYSPLKIGRFCSIGEGVKVGLGSHPLDRFSTSPYFYAKDWQFNQKNKAWNYGFKVMEEYKDKSFSELMSIEIGDDVWICANVCIKGGIKIGNGVVLAAGAVVTRNVPDFEIWGGVPAKKIGERKIQQKFAHEYKSWGILTQKDFQEFLPWKKKIRNFLKLFDS